MNLDVTIKLFDDIHSLILLERKDYVKYLGVLIDSTLTWRQHILFISSKISKSLGIISRLRHFVPTDTLLSIYQSLVQPYITYGIAVWGQAAQTNLNFQHCKSVCTIMHDVSNNSLPPNISTLFSTYDVDFESNPGDIGGKR